MNVKERFPVICTLVLMGFILVNPICSEIPSSVMVLVAEASPTDPKISIPEDGPAEKVVSAEALAQSLEGGSASISTPSASSPPPITSFSVMTKVPPTSVITIRPAEPSVSASVPTQGSTPNADPQLGSPPTAPGAVIPAQPLQTPKPRTGSTPTPNPVTPPEPPQSLRVAEPKAPAPPVREPVTMPVHPLPEAPARTPPDIGEPKEEKISYSRTVKAIVGQFVEIPFRGTGWIYIGEQGSRQGISYDSRRLEKEGQNFIFRAETPGTYTLKFYKQDFIEDYIINDYVQVIVNENSAGTNRSQPLDRGRVLAEPRWPALPEESEPTLPPATSAAGTPNPPAVQDPASNPPAAPIPPPVLVDYLQQAREAYTAGQFPQALSLLDEFRERYPGGSDEAWWLYGQSFEANSPRRDIRSAMDYYRRLIREYPQSSHGIDAQRRISYLERYYFNIQ